MRLSKAVTIDDDKITVHEIIVEDFLQVADAADKELSEQVLELLPKCTDLTVEKMKKMAPSELKRVWDAFREVNAVFFSVIETLGLYQAVIPQVKSVILAEMTKQMRDGLTGRKSSSDSADLLSGDT